MQHEHAIVLSPNNSRALCISNTRALVLIPLPGACRLFTSLPSGPADAGLDFMSSNAMPSKAGACGNAMRFCTSH